MATYERRESCSEGQEVQPSRDIKDSGEAGHRRSSTRNSPSSRGPLHRGEHLSWERAGIHRGRHRLESGPFFSVAARLLKKVGLERESQHADPGHRRRQAAARGDRQSALQGREAAHTGRAHRGAQRRGIGQAAGAPGRSQGSRGHVHPHQPQAQRSERR
jgi:hypothetical protein